MRGEMLELGSADSYSSRRTGLHHDAIEAESNLWTDRSTIQRSDLNELLIR
jgi:hypothetical protein